MTRLRVAALALVLLAGCSKKPTEPQVSSAWFAWSGRLAGQQGSLVLDTYIVDTGVTGEVVFTDQLNPHYHLRGTVVGDSLLLAVDPAYPASTFTLRARVLADSLKGTISGGTLAAPVAFAGRALPRRQVIGDEGHDLPPNTDVIALAYDGTWIWASTLDFDYFRLGMNGAIHDTIAVFYEGYHWTSSTLAWDGHHVWGTVPGVIGPPVSMDYSELLDFDANGRAPDSLRLWQRSQGMAWDGTHLRTLNASWIKRLDGTGAILDSVKIDIPDAVHLTFDGNHYWTLGWYMHRLYEIDPQGQVVSICDLPSQSSPGAGLAAEGNFIWHAEAPLGVTTIHRLTLSSVAAPQLAQSPYRLRKTS